MKPASLSVVALAALALACADPALAPAGSAPGFVAGTIARVDVAFATPGIGGLTPDEARHSAAVVRQTARDWLEHEDRLRPDGDLAVSASLDALRLRSSVGAWLFAWALAPDHLSARVVVRRSGASVAEFPVRVESALAGYDWRDRDERLERLARRLGQRLAARLEPGPPGPDAAL